MSAETLSHISGKEPTFSGAEAAGWARESQPSEEQEVALWKFKLGERVAKDYAQYATNGDHLPSDTQLDTLAREIASLGEGTREQRKTAKLRSDHGLRELMPEVFERCEQALDERAKESWRETARRNTLSATGHELPEDVAEAMLAHSDVRLPVPIGLIDNALEELVGTSSGVGSRELESRQSSVLGRINSVIGEPASSHVSPSTSPQIEKKGGLDLNRARVDATAEVLQGIDLTIGGNEGRERASEVGYRGAGGTLETIESELAANFEARGGAKGVKSGLDWLTDVDRRSHEYENPAISNEGPTPRSITDAMSDSLEGYELTNARVLDSIFGIVRYRYNDAISGMLLYGADYTGLPSRELATFVIRAVDEISEAIAAQPGLTDEQRQAAEDIPRT